MPLEFSRGVAASNGYSTYVDIMTGENLLAKVDLIYFSCRSSSRRGGLGGVKGID